MEAYELLEIKPGTIAVDGADNTLECQEVKDGLCMIWRWVHDDDSRSLGTLFTVPSHIKEWEVWEV